MKKISQPEGPRPEVSPNVEKESMEAVSLNDMPELPKKVLDYDLKKIKSFKAIRKNYKANSQKKVFVSDLSVVLDQYPAHEHQLDTDLLVHVLNISENFFVFGSKEVREQAKSEAVKQLMTKYFRGDEEVLESVIGSVFHKVKKSNMFRRVLKRIKLYFKKDLNLMA
jgi:hypothetical protein